MPAIGNPTPPLVGGNSVRQPILEGYVFQSGIHKPEHSSILTYKYPQYYLTSLLDKLGSYEGVSQNVFSWNIQDRTRASATVKASTGLVSGGTTSDAVATLILDGITFDSVNLGYFIVGDVVRLDSGEICRVTTTAANSGEQEIDIATVDGSNFGTTIVAGTTTLGHVFTSFNEGSDAPNGRLFLPTEDYNYLTILRRSFQITGSEFTNKTWLGDGSAWYWTLEDLHMKEFARDREGAIMFGNRASTASGDVSRGLLDWVTSEGVINTYASATGVSEADLRGHIQSLLVEGSSNEMVVLCGSKFLADVQVALRDYAINGGINYGMFGDNMAGLDFQSYKFLGKTIHFAYYELFDDPEMLPYSGTPSAAKIDFSDFSLWLDFGNTSSGEKLISLKYKENDGYSRKFIHRYEVGMMSPAGDNGGFVASGFDGFQIHYLSEIGLKVLLANRMGILRANS